MDLKDSKGSKDSLVSRIALMEERFDSVARVIGELDGAVSGYERIKDDIDALEDYMASGQWMRDFEADEAGEIPEGVKRGVLSEDGLYDLLDNAEALIDRIRSIFGSAEDIDDTVVE